MVVVADQSALQLLLRLRFYCITYDFSSGRIEVYCSTFFFIVMHRRT